VEDKFYKWNNTKEIKPNNGWLPLLLPKALIKAHKNNCGIIKPALKYSTRSKAGRF
jgi:hypothetical protein